MPRKEARVQLVERLRAHPWLAVACAGALVGITIGLFLPIRAASQSKADEAKWTLPTPASVKRFDEAKYQALRRAPFWGEVKQPGERGQQVAGWSLSGIVTRPSIRAAVTLPGKRETTWVTLGGALPDGATFVAANRDTIWYEKDGCRRARKLYLLPKAQSDACIGAKGEPAAAPSGTPTPPPVTSPAPPPARRPH